MSSPRGVGWSPSPYALNIAYSSPWVYVSHDTLTPWHRYGRPLGGLDTPLGFKTKAGLQKQTNAAPSPLLYEPYYYYCYCVWLSLVIFVCLSLFIIIIIIGFCLCFSVGFYFLVLSNFLGCNNYYYFNSSSSVNSGGGETPWGLFGFFGWYLIFWGGYPLGFLNIFLYGT